MNPKSSGPRNIDYQLSQGDTDSIAGRTLRGTFYSTGASFLTILLGIVRAVLLARLILPEHFGTMALALVFLTLAAKSRSFGLDIALIHKKEAEEEVISTYFTLRLSTLILSLGIIILIIPLITHFYKDFSSLGLVMLVLTGIEFFGGLNSVQETLLRKDLEFRTLALTNMVASIMMTIIAPWMAWLGWGVWALVGERAIGIMTRWFMVWFVFRRWKPHFAWNKDIALWFWDYGKAVWGASFLSFLLDRFDDFWTGTFLGKTPLGYYSRSYEFARYPRRVVANPLTSVFTPTFAKLQGDRERLSKAFYRMSSLIVRLGFLLALVLILTAPEFISLILGKNWIPMTVPFQLMVVYITIDPIILGMSQLLFAVGQPKVNTRVRLWQFIFFVPAVAVLGTLWGIAGVAVAADLMLVLGVGLLGRTIHDVVDFSWRALLFWPFVAMLIATGAVMAGGLLWGTWSPLALIVVKAFVAAAAYLMVILAMEREQLRVGLRIIRHALQT